MMLGGVLWVTAGRSVDDAVRFVPLHLAHLLSACSFNYWWRTVEASDHNCRTVCLSAQLCHVFCFMDFEAATRAPQGACSQVKAVRENKKKKRENKIENKIAARPCAGHSSQL